MSLEPTPPFTPEGTEEILHELEHGSPETPERRRMFDLADSASFLVDPELARWVEKVQGHRR
jgi:hypothetical protein